MAKSMSTVTQLMNDADWEHASRVSPSWIPLLPLPAGASPLGIYFANPCYLSLSARIAFCDSICV